MDTVINLGTIQDPNPPIIETEIKKIIATFVSVIDSWLPPVLSALAGSYVGPCIILDGSTTTTHAGKITIINDAPNTKVLYNNVIYIQKLDEMGGGVQIYVSPEIMIYVWSFNIRIKMIDTEHLINNKCWFDWTVTNSADTLVLQCNTQKITIDKDKQTIVTT